MPALPRFVLFFFVLLQFNTYNRLQPFNTLKTNTLFNQ
jgi:hypothetical protein